MNNKTNVSKPISLSQAYIELLFCVAFWGAAFASMKVASAELGVFTAVWLRTFLGVAALIPFALYRGEFHLPTLKECLPLAFLGFQGIALHQNIQFYAMKTAGAANANWYIAATPSVVAVLGWLFLGERLTRRSVLGLLISGAGVLAVVGFGTKGLGLFRPGSVGELWMAFSSLNWAVFQILSRKLLKGAQPAFAILWINIFACIMQSALFVVFPGDFGSLTSVSSNGWAAILFLGLLCSGVAYIFWYDGLSVMPVVKVSAFQFIQPIFGVAAAYFISGERFTPFIFIGGVLVLTGVSMVNKVCAADGEKTAC